jgi:hypothetical protein
VTAAVDSELAAAVLAESARHKQRSPGRRAAGQVWVALMTTTSVDAARRAISTFGTKDVQRDALELFDRLTTTRQETPA